MSKILGAAAEGEQISIMAGGSVLPPLSVEQAEALQRYIGWAINQARVARSLALVSGEREPVPGAYEHMSPRPVSDMSQRLGRDVHTGKPPTRHVP